MGWGGHEVQWEHKPGGRGRPTSRRCTRRPTSSGRATLLDRYGVGYVVFGPIERTDLRRRRLAKWDQLGRRVYSRRGTTVWQLRR